jgi:hypothetical protein
MFGSLKKYATRKLIERQMKDAPQEQKDLLVGMVEKNPKLFEKISKEIKEAMDKNGGNQMAAAMRVLPKYRKELAEAFGPEGLALLAGQMGQRLQ